MVLLTTMMMVAVEFLCFLFLLGVFDLFVYKVRNSDQTSFSCQVTIQTFRLLQPTRVKTLTSSTVFLTIYSKSFEPPFVLFKRPTEALYSTEMCVILPLLILLRNHN